MLVLNVAQVNYIDKMRIQPEKLAINHIRLVNDWPIEDAHVSGTGSATGAACSQMWGMESKLPHPVAEAFKQQ